MEAQAALVGTQGRVELDSVAAVDAQLALVVLPDDAELDDALGDGDDLEGGAVLGVLAEERAVLERGDQLCGPRSAGTQSFTQDDTRPRWEDVPW